MIFFPISYAKTVLFLCQVSELDFYAVSDQNLAWSLVNIEIENFKNSSI